VATLAQIRQIEAALRGLSARAQREFLALWTNTEPGYRRTRLVYDYFPALIERYGSAAAVLGADVFEAEAVEMGIKPRVDLVPGVNAERASARLLAELNATTTLASSLALVDELVKQPYRSTFQDSAIASGAGWARVPRGDTCAFCIMLASRGGVYKTSDIAEFGYSGKKYHGECDCVPVLVRDEGDYPSGYDPDALYDKYMSARDQAGSGDTRRILASMRKLYDMH